MIHLCYYSIQILKADFDEDRIRYTQKLVLDKFCSTYVSIYGGAKVTNYIHIWMSGHLRFFLNEFKNLYIYSNIGFEGLFTIIIIPSFR